MKNNFKNSDANTWFDVNHQIYLHIIFSWTYLSIWYLIKEPNVTNTMVFVSLRYLYYVTKYSDLKKGNDTKKIQTAFLDMM